MKPFLHKLTKVQVKRYQYQTLFHSIRPPHDLTSQLCL